MRKETVFFQDFVNTNYNSNFNNHNYLGISSFEELIIGHSSYAFDPWYKMSNKTQPLQINIFTDKGGKGGK